MSSLADRLSEMTPMQLAYAARQMRAKLGVLVAEPLAIVGVGCRFPGDADDIDGFWDLLAAGRETVREVPPERWDIDAYYDPVPGKPGKMYTRHGSFLSGVDGFDPLFFGISPREATLMDPQQRLLLEVSWEALEHAGISPAALRGTETGVFMGIMHQDYAHLVQSSSRLDTHAGSGNGLSVMAGRIAHTLALEGPAMAVDTACSSSLVAVHLAAQSLRSHECDVALAGGVNLILSPLSTMVECQMRMLSPDGRCKAFDAGANGFVRGEGCGVIVLKRLSDAMADGDEIIALIRGSAVNHDGHSSGLTVPNGRAQERVIRAALRMGGVDPAQVRYVEAHGTGTSLGDPIEIEALGRVFGQARTREAPLVVGSLKTNIGHTEGAAGIAGLIKAALALRQAEIPQHLHFAEPNPGIRWSELPVQVPAQRMSWPDDGRRFAGVSSFGFAGTNAHVVLEAAPVPEAAPRPAAESAGREHLLVLAAKSPGALETLAARYSARLSQDPAGNLDLADVCHTARTGRAPMPYRLAAVAGDTRELGTRLHAFAMGEDADGVVAGDEPSATAPRIAFLFTGQGGLHPGAGRGLYDCEPVFRDMLDRCAEILAPHLGRPLTSTLFADAASEDASLLAQTRFAQPVATALQIALAEQWKRWGVVPAAVAGHSLGQYAAAFVAGVMSLEDALTLAAARGRLMQELALPGGMASVLAPATQVLEAMAPYRDRLSIAAHNGPSSTVLSGEREALGAVLSKLEAAGILTRMLDIPLASHSPLMAPVAEAFRAHVEAVRLAPPRLRVVSDLTGLADSGELVDPGYWCRHLLQPVQFARVLDTLRGLGVRDFVELGPTPMLIGFGQRCMPEDGASRQWLPSLRPDESERRTMLHSLGALHVRGVAVDWAAVEGEGPHRRVSLPTYPFERERYWIETGAGAGASALLQAARAGAIHPLLGWRVELAGSSEIRFEVALRPHSPAYLDDHRVGSVALLPGAAYVEMALAAAKAADLASVPALAEIVFERPVVLDEDGETILQLTLTPMPEGGHEFRIHCRRSEGDEVAWDSVASGKLAAAAAAAAGTGQDDAHAQAGQGDTLAALQQRLAETFSGDTYYAHLAGGGLAYGPSFRSIQTLYNRDDEALAHLRLSADLSLDDYALHPVLLDACFHSLGVTFPQTDADQAQADGSVYLPVGVEDLRILGPLDGELWAHIDRSTGRNTGRDTGGMEAVASLRLFAGDGRLVATAARMRFRKVRPDVMFAPRVDPLAEWLFRLDWQPAIPVGRRVPPAHHPAPADILAALRPELDALVARDDLAKIRGLLHETDALSVGYIVQALQRLGCVLEPGATFTAGDRARALGVAPGFQRLWQRMLDILVEENILRRRDDGYEVCASPVQPDTAGAMAALAARYPEAEIERALLERCGEGLVDVLRGGRDPLALLFPREESGSAPRVYQDSPGPQAINALVRAALTEAISRLPAERTLRVLEIGAGTGGTTTALLDLLPARRSEYVFTDISAHFLDSAARKYQAHDFIRYRTLDIERDPVAQGFDAGGYDIVVAANVLHATRDLRQTLAHARRLLAPAGLLVLVEVTHPRRWLDLTFGMTEGWWRFADTALRPAHPLLSGARWTALLAEEGFAGAAVLAGEDDNTTASDTAVIIARMPDAVTAAAEDSADDANTAAAVSGRHWLILGDSGNTGQRLTAALEALGERCSLVAGRDAQARGLAGLLLHPTHIVHLQGLDVRCPDDADALDLAAAYRDACGSALDLLHALLEAGRAPNLYLVTRGALAVTPGDQAAGFAQSMLHGMGKVIGLEHPQLRCVTVDLDAGVDSVEGLVAELISHCAGNGAGGRAGARAETRTEDRVAFRDGVRLVPRLLRHAPPVPGSAFACRGDAAYLITGGLAGLGLLTARFLVERGARHLILIGRRAPDAEAAAEVRALEAVGARVVVARADVSDEDALARALTAACADMPPLRGVIHSAGALDDGVLAQQTHARFAKVLAAKVQGSWNLHRLTRKQPLDFFVLYSSIVSLLGNIGQGNHAAANTFQDALVHYRHARGLPAMSINWGAWSQVGAAASDEIQDRLAVRGVGAIGPQEGIDILAALLASGVRSDATPGQTDAHETGATEAGAAPVPAPIQIGVMPLDLKLLGAAGRAVPLLSALAGAEDGAGEGSKRGDELLVQLRQARPTEVHALLIAYLQERLAQVLRLKGKTRPTPDRSLHELGLDSLMSVELKNLLTSELGVDLPVEQLVAGASIAEIATTVSQQLALGHLVPAEAPSGDMPAEDVEELTL